MPSRTPIFNSMALGRQFSPFPRFNSSTFKLAFGWAFGRIEAMNGMGQGMKDNLKIPYGLFICDEMARAGQIAEELM